MTTQVTRKKNEKLKGIEFVNITLIIVAFILFYISLPFWYYTYSNYKTKGVIVSIDYEKSKKIMVYQYYNHEQILIKKKRAISSQIASNINVRDEVEISYNVSYPEYVYISGLEVLPNLYRTILGPFFCIVLAIVFQLARYGIIKLNFA